MVWPFVLCAAGALVAGMSVAAEPGGQPADGPRAEAGKVSVVVRSGDKVLLEYKFADVPFKPYAIQFATPSGFNILRDAPHDHLHHHGIMFALAADGVDFWAETPRCGRQVHRSAAPAGEERLGGAAAPAFAEQLDWLDADGRCLLKETRTLQVCLAKDVGASLLVWQCELSPPPGKETVALTGSHYFGLGMRFLTSMDNVGKFITAEGDRTAKGVNVRGDEYVTPSTWCAYLSEADGKKVTAAMLGHPDNACHPTPWFTMGKPFAYLAATINLWKQPMTLAAKGPLKLRYAVALWDGHAEADRIEKLYRQWLTWHPPAKPGRPTTAPAGPGAPSGPSAP